MPKPLPIVLFPGVMASRLYFEASGGYWDPDSINRMRRWLPLWPFRADDDNRRDWHGREPGYVLIDPLTSAVPAEGVARGWGGLAWSYYGDYLKMLETLAPGRVFAVGYDWRQDIRWLGEYAAAKLRTCLEATKAKRLRVVTHSMGGLVVRAALKADPELAGRIARVLHVCQPAVGAVVLFRRLFTGLVSGLDDGYFFRWIMGSSRDGFAGNMSGQPGPMQLLPSEFLPVEASSPWLPDLREEAVLAELYQGTVSPPGLVGATLRLPPDALADLRQRVQEVVEFHAWLGAPGPVEGMPETWLIYGTGRKTETGVAYGKGRKVLAVPTLAGDGTVPAASALALGLPAERVFEVQGVEHSAACQSPAVHEATRQVLA